MEAMRTQPVPGHIAAACDALAAVLVGEPADVETQLVVAEALSILGDVTPPYPPMTYPVTGCAPAQGVAAALASLDCAVDSAGDVEEATRIGRAGHELRRLSRQESA
jgi:hypothetical protein